ncbi:MAG TPA: ribonuclease HII [Gemmatimonadaceae bacterium]|nr:ribonuclease HII [Gemmatimonadaceae bacterium]
MRWSTIERDLRIQHGPLIAGVDEVGRGPLAGPVVACAVVMPPERRAMPGVNDSKQLTAKKREKLVLKIRDNALGIGIGAASVREIDRLNILQASILAMRRALRRLPVTPNHVLIDGRALRTLEVQHTAVVHGDARCYSIACASIVAKITRDRVMHALSPRYPQYRWENNVGYSTANHLRGIAEHGITPHHRRSFLPCSQLSLDLATDAEVVIDAAQLSALIDSATEDLTH